MTIPQHLRPLAQMLAATHHAEMLRQLAFLRQAIGDLTHPNVVKAEAELAEARDLLQSLAESSNGND